LVNRKKEQRLRYPAEALHDWYLTKIELLFEKARQTGEYYSGLKGANYLSITLYMLFVSAIHIQIPANHYHKSSIAHALYIGHLVGC
jgi:hypothetical protein